MHGPEGWASTAAALPTDARRARETPFWRALVERFSWRRVADAGCGSGFHVALLREIGVEVFGFDRALAPLVEAARGHLLVGDLLAPPLRAHTFDAVLCLGNTVSLLGSRWAQRTAIAALARVLHPGGALLLQGEDVGALVASGPVVRTRSLSDGRVHLRVFERRGRRVEMRAGVVAPGAEARLEGAWLLPTSAASLAEVGAAVRLKPIPLPVDPPGGGATWWLLLAGPANP